MTSIYKEKLFLRSEIAVPQLQTHPLPIFAFRAPVMQKLVRPRVQRCRLSFLVAYIQTGGGTARHAPSRYLSLTSTRKLTHPYQNC